MKAFKLIVLLSFLLVSAMQAQEQKFTVELSSDTILLGNYFELKYTIENMNGKFDPPNLGEFDVIGGPNTSTSMSMINGTVKKSTGFSYYIKPRDLGVFTIPPAFVTVGEEVYQTVPIEIIVVPNPDGIIQQPNRPSLRFEDIMPKQNPPAEKPEKSARPRKRF